MQLRKDGRQPLTEISRRIGVPVSTIFDKVKANKDDMITRFTCLMDFRQLGFNCRAHMVFRIHKDHRVELQKYLTNHPNVNSLYKINNGYDFLVETVFRELKEVDEFLEKIDDKFKVHEKKVYYIIEDIAREVFLTEQLHGEIIGVV
jgi:DNA-binding Lrp family transcriptional regulator